LSGKEGKESGKRGVGGVDKRRRTEEAGLGK